MHRNNFKSDNKMEEGGHLRVNNNEKQNDKQGGGAAIECSQNCRGHNTQQGEATIESRYGVQELVAGPHAARHENANTNQREDCTAQEHDPRRPYSTLHKRL